MEYLLPENFLNEIIEEGRDEFGPDDIWIADRVRARQSMIYHLIVCMNSYLEHAAIPRYGKIISVSAKKWRKWGFYQFKIIVNFFKFDPTNEIGRKFTVTALCFNEEYVLAHGMHYLVDPKEPITVPYGTFAGQYSNFEDKYPLDKEEDDFDLDESFLDMLQPINSPQYHPPHFDIFDQPLPFVLTVQPIFEEEEEEVILPDSESESESEDDDETEIESASESEVDLDEYWMMSEEEYNEMKRRESNNKREREDDEEDEEERNVKRVYVSIEAI